MRMLLFTKEDGDRLYVNPDHIQTLQEASLERATLYVGNVGYLLKSHKEALKTLTEATDD